MGLRELGRSVLSSVTRWLERATDDEPYPMTREEIEDAEREEQRKRSERWLRDNNEA